MGATQVRTAADPSQPEPEGESLLVDDGPAPRNRRRGDGGLVLLIVAVALLLVGTLVGGVLLLTGSPANDRADDEAGVDRVIETSEAPATTSPSSSPEAAAPTTRVRCWDPSLEVSRVEDCGTPRDAKGLRWVFPSATGQDCQPVNEGDKDFVLSCRVQAPSGHKATIRYSQYAGTTVAVRHNDEHYGEWGETRLAGPRRRVWASPGPIRGHTWKVAAMYADAAFGVSVEAATRSDRDHVFSRAVTFRKRADLWGRAVVD